jgi:predicted phosphodiesterase
MRFAVISDIQGNSVALKAALDAISSHPRVDRIVSTGDLVGLGPEPNEVLETLREHAIEAVLGNYDDAVAFDRMGPGMDFQTVEDEDAELRVIEWTRETLTAENMEFLRALPKDLRITPGPGGGRVKRDQGDEVTNEYRRSFFSRALFGGLARTPSNPGRRIRVLHGSPRALNEFVRGDSANSILTTLAEHAQAEVLVTGHARTSFQRTAKNTTFVGVGPVDATREGGATAQYVVVDVGREVETEFGEAAYDAAQYADAVRRSGMPVRPVPIGRFRSP